MKTCETCNGKKHVRLLQMMADGKLQYICEPCLPKMFNKGFRLLDYPNGELIPWSMKENWNWIVSKREAEWHQTQ